MKKLLALLFALSFSVSAHAQGFSGMGIPNTPPGIQVNLTAVADPTVNNDSTLGYQVGSLWQNSATGQVWIARSVAVGAAVWNALEPSDFPGYIVGNWVAPFGYTSTATSGALAVNTLRCYPGYIKQRVSISSLGGRVVANAAGNVQFAIYRANLATGRPTGTPAASTASMSTAAAGTISSAASAQFEQGLYWFCANTDTAALTFTTQMSGTSGIMGQIIGSAAQGSVFGSGSGSLTGVSLAQTFGTWPNVTASSFTELSGNNAIAGVEFLIQSIP
jgi:hypothetical protein